MSGPGFGLVIGAQTKAAGYVVDFESKLVDVADMLESCILDDVARVNGPYVSVLSDALQRWVRVQTHIRPTWSAIRRH